MSKSKQIYLSKLESEYKIIDGLKDNLSDFVLMLNNDLDKFSNKVRISGDENMKRIISDKYINLQNDIFNLISKLKCIQNDSWKNSRRD